MPDLIISPTRKVYRRYQNIYQNVCITHNVTGESRQLAHSHVHIGRIVSHEFRLTVGIFCGFGCWKRLYTLFYYKRSPVRNVQSLLKAVNELSYICSCLYQLPVHTIRTILLSTPPPLLHQHRHKRIHHTHTHAHTQTHTLSLLHMHERTRTHTHTHAHILTRTPHTHTYTHTLTQANKHAHSLTDTPLHTQTVSVSVSVSLSLSLSLSVSLSLCLSVSLSVSLSLSLSLSFFFFFFFF